MNTNDAKLKINQFMYQYGIFDWSFEFSEAKDLFGQANESKKTIYLSRPLTELNDEVQVTDTMLHEIAHALTPGCGHNEVWRRVAIAIGANGQRCYDDAVETPMHKWIAHCPTCGKDVPRHKKNKRLYCGSCHKSGHRMTKAIKFVWHINKGGKI